MWHRIMHTSEPRNPMCLCIRVAGCDCFSEYMVVTKIRQNTQSEILIKYAEQKKGMENIIEPMNRGEHIKLN